MNLALRFCNPRFQWMQRRLFLAHSVPNTPLHNDAWRRGQSQTCMTTNRSEFRFYSGSSVYFMEQKQVSNGTPSATTQEMLDFTEQLQGCSSPSDVLGLSRENLPAIFHVNKSLMHMWDTTKKMPGMHKHHEVQLIFKHPAFENLLQKAIRCVGHMHPLQISFNLMRMVKLGVPQNSRVIQTFLRTCQERLNEFDERSLSILAKCLMEMEQSINVTLLKECMRLLVDACLPEIKEVKHLQNLMLMLGKDTPQKLKYKFMKKAILMGAEMSTPEAQRMITVLGEVQLDSKPLVAICSNKLLENIQKTPFLRLIALLQACEKLRSCPTHLLTGISDFVASNFEKWTSKELCFFLSAFEKLRFCPTSLMKAMTEKLIAHPEKWQVITFLCFLRVYASLNYDAEQSSGQFLERLTQGVNLYLPDLSGWELLQTVFCLCVLGHFVEAPLEKLLQARAIEKFPVSNMSEKHRDTFRMVHMCLLLDQPNLSCPLTVPPSVLGEHEPDGQPVHQWLSETVRSVVAEQPRSSLQEMVVVENFILIDGVVTIPPSEASSPVEGSQRVAVLCQLPQAFHFGTNKPCGTLALKLRHLRILGYRPVVINGPKLRSFPKEKRREILSRLIFSEHHNNLNSSNEQQQQKFRKKTFTHLK